MCKRVPSIYRQIDALEAQAEQLPFTSALLVCLEFAEVRRTLAFGPSAHARALHQLVELFQGRGASKPLQALLEAAYRAVIVHTRAIAEADKARMRPFIRTARQVRQMRSGVHYGAAGARGVKCAP